VVTRRRAKATADARFRKATRQAAPSPSAGVISSEIGRCRMDFADPFLVYGCCRS
jgi:hypothetical protein